MANKLWSIERRKFDDTQPLTVDDAKVWAASGDEAIQCVIDQCYADFKSKKVGGRFDDWAVITEIELTDKPVIISMEYCNDD